mgnify:CR=1 FL=1
MNKFINVLDSSDIRYFQDELNPSDWVDISNYRQMTKEEVLKFISHIVKLIATFLPNELQMVSSSLSTFLALN